MGFWEDWGWGKESRANKWLENFAGVGGPRETPASTGVGNGILMGIGGTAGGAGPAPNIAPFPTTRIGSGTSGGGSTPSPPPQDLSQPSPIDFAGLLGSGVPQAGANGLPKEILELMKQARGGTNSTSTTVTDGTPMPNFSPALNALRQQLAEARSEYAQERVGLNKRGQAVTTQLANDYASAATGTKQGKAQYDKGIDAATKEVGQNYAKAVQESKGLDGLAGGSGAAPNEMGGILDAMLSGQGASRQSELATSKVDNQGIVNDMLSGIAVGKAEGTRESRQRMLDLLSDARTDYRREKGTLDQNLANLLVEQSKARAAAAPRKSTTTTNSPMDTLAWANLISNVAKDQAGAKSAAAKAQGSPLDQVSPEKMIASIATGSMSRAALSKIYADLTQNAGKDGFDLTNPDAKLNSRAYQIASEMGLTGGNKDLTAQEIAFFVSWIGQQYGGKDPKRLPS
jgi:hypothetical protein